MPDFRFIKKNADSESKEINETSNVEDSEQAGGFLPFNLASKVAEGAVQAAGAVMAAADQAAKLAQDGLGTATAAAEDKMLQMRIAHYNPIFPAELYSPAYDIPDLVVLVDGDQRKGIDVCEGAVGWLSIEQKMEVLHLYKAEIDNIDINFYPMPKLDAAYLVDAYDPKRYIEVSSYVDTMKQDVFTELRQVAYMLGAKWCQLEASETSIERDARESKKGAKINAKVPGHVSGKADVSGSASIDQSSRTDKRVLFTQTFEGNAEPVRPVLNRLKHDNEIAFLIDTRCDVDDKNIAKDYAIELSTSSIVSVSEAQAGKIDVAVRGIGVGGSTSLQKKVSKELHSKMTFTVRF